LSLLFTHITFVHLEVHRIIRSVNTWYAQVAHRRTASTCKGAIVRVVTPAGRPARTGVALRVLVLTEHCKATYKSFSCLKSSD